MVCNQALECTECGCQILTKVTLGYGRHCHFLFPCPQCRLELGFSVNLFPEQRTFEFVDFINVKRSNVALDLFHHKHIFKFDVAHLIPNNCPSVLSPFLVSCMIVQDKQILKKHQERAQWSFTKFPVFQKLSNYYNTSNIDLFNKSIAKYFNAKEISSPREMLNYLLFFWVKSFCCFMSESCDKRIELAKYRDKILLSSPKACEELLKYYIAEDRIALLWSQLQELRSTWGKSIADILLPFNFVTDTQNIALLKDCYVCQKCFDELKSFYVDCFETLNRFAVIFAAFMAIDKHGDEEIKIGINNMPLTNFDRLPNGKKIEIFKEESYIWEIISCLDNKKRNGIGHNSARYNVLSDSILMRVQSPSGKIDDFELSYNDFCFNLLQLYIAIENLSVFIHWLYKKYRNYI